MEDFAKVRVVRAPHTNGLQLRVEVSSDGGATWKLLPTATPDEGYAAALKTSKGKIPCVAIEVAVTSALGGSVELEREAAR